MNYLVKDLSKITGLSSARIRKWQERYNILEPHCAQNGYWYYSNQDLFVLRSINELLLKEVPLLKIMEMGRTKLLAKQDKSNEINLEGIESIRAISDNNYKYLQSYLSKKKSENFEVWIERLSKFLVLIGKSWYNGVLSIADEHSFSIWFIGFFKDSIKKYEKFERASALVVSFPGDEHTLGALLQYGRLLNQGVHVKFCGMLPEKELFRELSSGEYSELSVSITIPCDRKKVQTLVSKIQNRFKSLRIRIGGFGVNEN